MKRFIQRALVGTSVCLVAVVGAGAGTASAGEITGKGGTPMKVDGQLHAKSACAFSGLNDEFVLGDTSAPRVQTPAEAPPGVAGFACRGNVVFPE